MLKLVYTFTKKLHFDNALDRLVEVYKRFYKHNIQFHDIALYTDKESKYLFEDTFKDIIIEDTSDIRFFDDFKMKVLPKLNKYEVLTDGDIYLYQPLNLDHNQDIICDVLQPPIWYYKEIPYRLVQKGIRDIIPYFTADNEPIPNIGIFKFTGKEDETKYLSDYYKLREFMITNCEDIMTKFPIKFVSVIMSQYLLGCYDVSKYEMRPNNDYKHFSGGYKYNEKDFLNQFNQKSII